MRTSVYAFDEAFETAIGAMGTPLVGVIAQYGFGMSLKDVYAEMSDGGGAWPAGGGAGGSIEQAKALSDSLLLMLVYPWTLCLAFYTLLHLYYGEWDRLTRLRCDAVWCRACGCGVEGTDAILTPTILTTYFGIRTHREREGARQKAVPEPLTQQRCDAVGRRLNGRGRRRREERFMLCSSLRHTRLFVYYYELLIVQPIYLRGRFGSRSASLRL